MPFWSSSKPRIPDSLPKGGLLSHYGGHPAAVQYRVYVKTIDGKTFYHAEDEFQGILVAWRKFQQDLEYYVEISLPVGVVWDPGIRSYREVDLDTMLGWIKAESRDWYDVYKKKQAEEAEREKAAILEQRRSIVEEMAQMPPHEEIVGKKPAPVKKGKKGKKGPYVAETISPLQSEELAEYQRGVQELGRRAEKLKKEETEREQNPSRKAIIADIVRYLTPNLPPVAVRQLKADLRFQSVGSLKKFWNDVRGKNPRVRRDQFGPSYAWVVPQNREAYVWLKEFTAGESTWARTREGTGWQGMRLLVDLRYLDELVEGAEKAGFVFKKHRGQKPGPVDFVAFVVEEVSG